MGGTSTDCSTIIDGAESFTSTFELEWGIPIQVPMVDVRTIGAGGGSIAWIDKGGLLRVGPQSAGAQPGPACYGRGGSEATVTDAQVVLGRISPKNFLGGAMQLDAEAAQRAVAQDRPAHRQGRGGDRARHRAHRQHQHGGRVAGGADRARPGSRAISPSWASAAPARPIPPT